MNRMKGRATTISERKTYKLISPTSFPTSCSPLLWVILSNFSIYQNFQVQTTNFSNLETHKTTMVDFMFQISYPYRTNPFEIETKNDKSDVSTLLFFTEVYINAFQISVTFFCNTKQKLHFHWQKRSYCHLKPPQLSTKKYTTNEQ
uniref:Uncharacterized protein n=1 Tax=Parascaris equorum TaxID=6256 RepID=A0A914S0J9_PAREQ